MKKNIYKRIGAVCANFRKEKGYTQANVADWVGCTVSNVSRFETGSIRSVAVLAWYIAFGITTDELRGAIYG